MPDDNRTIVFAGPADIADDNMQALLDNWLPQDIELNPPAIQKRIPRGSKGLAKVLKWVEDELGDLDRPDDLAAYIKDIGDASNAFLVVLWGEGGDEKTEALIDQASRHGLTVLDLTDGLEELKLADNEPPAAPEPEAAEAAAEGTTRRSRRRRGEDTEPEATADEKPPWKEDVPLTLPPDEFALVKMLIQLAEGAAAHLRGYLVTLQPGAAAVEVLQAPASDEPTRTWLKNPAAEEYKLKGRGRPRRDMQSWAEVQLTEIQEKELGLA